MYLRDYPLVPYRFGNQERRSSFPDISIYVDVVDQLKHVVGFYREFYIPEGSRPDTVSHELYGRSDYYWTFFILNDSLRRSGWPLNERDLRPFLKKELPYTTFTSSNLAALYNDFLPGENIKTLAGDVVKVVDRNLDLGQVITEKVSIVETGSTVVTLESDPSKSFVAEKHSDQLLSTHHYEDADGNWVDIDPEAPIPSLLVDVSWLDYYRRENEKNRFINVLKPEAIGDVIRDFKQKALA